MNSAIAGWFPLMSRPRPLGLPLPVRVAALAEYLDGTDSAGHHQVARASSVINLASLIASDVGLHDLAFEMCWKHFALFANATHLDDPSTAVMAVQPLMNIARLLTREGDGQHAYDVLEQLYQAARARSATEICGHTVDVSAVIRNQESHRKIAAELWMALLTDGLRALARAGRWTQAAQMAAVHKGVDDRLWDGRQATIVALVEQEEYEQATTMLTASRIGDAPERAAAAVMQTFCALESGDIAAADFDASVGQALVLIQKDEPPTTVFRTHLALTALAVADAAGSAPRTASRLRHAVIAAASTDAYAARAVIAGLGNRAETLRPIVESGGLGHGPMPPGLLDQLAASVTDAEARLRENLGHDHRWPATLAEGT